MVSIFFKHDPQCCDHTLLCILLMLSPSVVSDSVIPWTVAHQASLSIGLFRQEYGLGRHFLLQGIFPTQRSNLHLLPWQTVSLYWATWEAPASVYMKLFYDNVYVEKTIIMRWPVTLFLLFKCWLWPSTLISWPHKIVLSDGTLWVWKCFVSVLSIIVPLVTCGHQALEMWLVWLRNWVFHFHIG